MSVFTPEKFAAHLLARGAGVIYESDQVVFAGYENRRIIAEFDPETGRFQRGISMRLVDWLPVDDVDHSSMKSLVDSLRLPVESQVAA